MVIASNDVSQYLDVLVAGWSAPGGVIAAAACVGACGVRAGVAPGVVLDGCAACAVRRVKWAACAMPKRKADA